MWRQEVRSPTQIVQDKINADKLLADMKAIIVRTEAAISAANAILNNIRKRDSITVTDN
jgi:hypothetical protein